VGEVSDGQVRQFILTPEEFGFERADLRDLSGCDPQSAAREAVGLLQGRTGPKRDMLLLNSAAGVYVAGKAESLTEALPMATEALDSGKAFEKLTEFVKATGGDSGRIEEYGRA
jgi:anthranilate phosphoribosyltransferase